MPVSVRFTLNNGKRRRVPITTVDRHGVERLSDVGNLLERLYYHPKRDQGVTREEFIQHFGHWEIFYNPHLFDYASSTGLVRQRGERLEIVDLRAVVQLLLATPVFKKLQRDAAYMSLRRSHSPEISGLISSFI